MEELDILKKKIEKIREILNGRIEEYKQFCEESIKGKEFKDLSSLDWELLSGYSSEKDLAELILRILEKEP